MYIFHVLFCFLKIIQVSLVIIICLFMFLYILLYSFVEYGGVCLNTIHFGFVFFECFSLFFYYMYFCSFLYIIFYILLYIIHSHFIHIVRCMVVYVCLGIHLASVKFKHCSFFSYYYYYLFNKYILYIIYIEHLIVCMLGVWSKWCFLVWGYISSVNFIKLYVSCILDIHPIHLNKIIKYI